MAWKRVIFASLVLAILFLQEALAGPAHSLAMAMAARAAKIPRTIRAPFRNTEMMTARGFGKRSQELYPSEGELIGNDGTCIKDEINLINVSHNFPYSTIRNDFCRR